MLLPIVRRFSHNHVDILDLFQWVGGDLQARSCAASPHRRLVPTRSGVWSVQHRVAPAVSRRTHS